MPAPTGRGTAAGQADWAIDTSATMPWFFPDEATPFTESLLDSLGAQTIWAPTLWVFECANVLRSATRRQRLDPLRRVVIAEQLAELPVHIDLEPPSFVTLDRLAATHGLSAYDAVYLELALRRSLTLVTLDVQLVNAARNLGHPVLTAP